MPAGDLRYKVGFYQRGGPAGGSPPPPDYGFPEGDYPSVATFTKPANITPRLGGESILAARLQGKNFVIVLVRQDSETAQVDTDWKAKDEDSGDEFNIRSVIDPEHGKIKHGFWFEMLCEKGVAT
jgi:Phage head-tail joining protein